MSTDLQGGAYSTGNNCGYADWTYRPPYGPNLPNWDLVPIPTPYPMPYPTVWPTYPMPDVGQVGLWSIAGNCLVCGSPIYAQPSSNILNPPQTRRSCECKPVA